jgi:hypothetical protein
VEAGGGVNGGGGGGGGVESEGGGFDSGGLGGSFIGNWWQVISILSGPTPSVKRLTQDCYEAAGALLNFEKKVAPCAS